MTGSRSESRDKIVLCEGKRDVWLVETYYEEVTHSVAVDSFVADDYQRTSLKSVESNTIKRFLDRRNRDDVLVKSEGGIPDLKWLFVKLSRALFRLWDVDVCLVVDLDEADHDRWSRSIYSPSVPISKTPRESTRRRTTTTPSGRNCARSSTKELPHRCTRCCRPSLPLPHSNRAETISTGDRKFRIFA